MKRQQAYRVSCCRYPIASRSTCTHRSSLISLLADWNTWIMSPRLLAWNRDSGSKSNSSRMSEDHNEDCLLLMDQMFSVMKTLSNQNNSNRIINLINRTFKLCYHNSSTKFNRSFHAQCTFVSNHTTFLSIHSDYVHKIFSDIQQIQNRSLSST